MRNPIPDLMGNRPWPRVVVLGSGSLAGGCIVVWNFIRMEVVKWGLLALTLLVFFWWWDVYREGSGGTHNRGIRFALRYGMALFIGSEILFFAAFFWSYFHGNWHPEQGDDWTRAEYGAVIIDPFGIPFLNTLILLISGVVVTLSHHRTVVKAGYTRVTLAGTILLGVYFMMMQMVEYEVSGFSANRSRYGTLFFLLTGFHGLHVTIGVILLRFTLYRHERGSMKERKHVFHEAAAWYWHFVDVVWLGLYLFIYWYGMDGNGPTVI